MIIEVFRNDLAVCTADIPDEYYQTLIKLKSSVGYVFGFSKKQLEAIEYLKLILNGFIKEQQDVLLEKLNLTRRDLYGI